MVHRCLDSWQASHSPTCNNKMDTRTDKKGGENDINAFDEFIKISVDVLITIGIMFQPVKLRLSTYICSLCLCTCTAAILTLFIKLCIGGNLEFVGNHVGHLDKFLLDLVKHFRKSIDEEHDYDVKRHSEQMKKLLTRIFAYVSVLIYERGSVHKNGNHFPFDLVFPMYYHPFDVYQHGIFEIVFVVHCITNYVESTLWIQPLFWVLTVRCSAFCSRFVCILISSPRRWKGWRLRNLEQPVLGPKICPVFWEIRCMLNFAIVNGYLAHHFITVFNFRHAGFDCFGAAIFGAQFIREKIIVPAIRLGLITTILSIK